MEVENAADIYNALLEKGIAIRLMGNYLRVCAGSDEENDAFLNALRDCLKGA
jgi:histidinol-phosphate aminotransferase